MHPLVRFAFFENYFRGLHFREMAFNENRSCFLVDCEQRFLVNWKR